MFLLTNFCLLVISPLLFILSIINMHGRLFAQQHFNETCSYLLSWCHFSVFAVCGFFLLFTEKSFHSGKCKLTYKQMLHTHCLFLFRSNNIESDLILLCLGQPARVFCFFEGLSIMVNSSSIPPANQ